MKLTKIQWCHSTINPVMGCDGCELWPGPGKISGTMVSEVVLFQPGLPPSTELWKIVNSVIGDRDTSGIYANREAIATELVEKLGLEKQFTKELVDIVRSACKCYAGILGTNRAGHKGYADSFVEPKLFPGRMAEAARWGSPSESEHAAKPWLAGAPRMIFVSDMGDALSDSVPYAYLKQEIIDVVSSEAGTKHLWLWLTKRPSRMAGFGRWLLKQGVQWPDNLVAMTTVTSQATAGRMAELRKVPSKFKGLSIEPLFTELNLDLTGIDWCIVGGGSDVLTQMT
jgi:protein gp37